MLVSLDCKKDFIIYCYALEHTFSSILTQKDDQDNEAPIAFMSVPLKKHELNYTQMEKHIFVLVKAMKQFGCYIFHSHSSVYVHEIVVKSILTQQEIRVNKRIVWVARIQEYELTIKPTTLLRGQGLCKLIVENKGSSSESTEITPSILLASSTDPWFSQVVYFLTYGECPPNLSYK